MSVSKERLWYYHSQGNNVLNVCKPFLYYFALEQTLHFPEFAEWCAINYSPSQRIIVSQSTSRILCKVNATVIRENLSLPENYPDSHKSINESTLAEFYKNVKLKPIAYSCQVFLKMVNLWMVFSYLTLCTFLKVKSN